MRAVKQLSTILALGLAMLLFRIGPAGAAVFEVRVDTSGVSGDAVMAFDFSNSDPGSEHQLVISNFASNGSLNLASGDPAACPTVDPIDLTVVFPLSVDPCKNPADSSVTGTLGQIPAVPVTISDAGSTSALITYFQGIDLTGATSISFRFEMSGDPTSSGEAPDGFAFSLLDLSGFPIVSPDDSGLLVLYSFGGECGASEGVATCTEVRVPSVPEPAPVTLAVAALLALTCARCAAAASHRRGATRV